MVGACALWGMWFSVTSGTTPAVSAGARPAQTLGDAHLECEHVAGDWVQRLSEHAEGPGLREDQCRRWSRDRPATRTRPCESGKIYYYVTRAVDAKGKESFGFGGSDGDGFREQWGIKQEAIRSSMPVGCGFFSSAAYNLDVCIFCAAARLRAGLKPGAYITRCGGRSWVEWRRRGWRG